MNRRRISALAAAVSTLTVCVVIAAGSAPDTSARQGARPPGVPTARTVRSQVASPIQRAGTATASPTPNEVVKTYCLTCHNDQVRRGELSFASFDVARAGEHADIGEKMIRKLRLGMMPPKEAS